MVRLTACVIALGSLATASVALAQPPPPDGDEGCGELACPPPPPRALGLQMTVAVMLGQYGVGGVHDGAAGVAVQAGHRWGDWMAFGEYDGLGLGGDDLRDGTLHRAGAALRYDAIDVGKQLSAKVWAGGVVWLEGGLGLERARWPGGTNVDRSDVAFGIGAEYRIKFGGERPRMIGVFYQARFLYADAPARTTIASLCVEGCPGTPLDTRDLGVFFVGGLTFAR